VKLSRHISARRVRLATLNPVFIASHASPPPHIHAHIAAVARAIATTPLSLPARSGGMVSSSDSGGYTEARKASVAL